MIFFDEKYVLGMLLASLLYWFVIPKRYRVLYISVISIGALAWIQPIFTLILGAVVLGVFIIAGRIANLPNGKVKKLATGITLLAIFLLVCKYARVLMIEIFSNEASFIQYIIVPLGVSYLSFKLIAFVLDVYRGVIEKFTFLDLLAFIVFLPTFPAGPIERFQNFEPLHEIKFDTLFYSEGLKRIAFGYTKKVILVNFILTELLIKRLQPDIFSNISWELPAFKAILFLLLALLYSYLDLSSYADLAIGYSRLFGYHIIEDMESPIFKPDLSQYWNSWHISLSSWCRNNIYFPVLGATRRNNFALYCSFIVMGLWHNLSYNWVMWGLWHASGLIIFAKWSKIKRKFLKKHKSLKGVIPKPLGYGVGVGLTCLYSSGSFAFIFLDGRTSMLQDTKDALKLLLTIFF